MRAFAAEHGLVERYELVKRREQVNVWDHHEIYLFDPRRTSPENLKTLVRHPV